MIRDRNTSDPGGCECLSCGAIFIGGPEHDECGDCHARPATTTQRATQRPEFILSALGDMVFDGDEWYEELLADWRAQGQDA